MLTDDSEDMEGRSTELGLRSADYDQEVFGDDNVNFSRVQRTIFDDFHVFFLRKLDGLTEERSHSGPWAQQRARLLAMLLQRGDLLLSQLFLVSWTMARLFQLPFKINEKLYTRQNL